MSHNLFTSVVCVIFLSFCIFPVEKEKSETTNGVSETFSELVVFSLVAEVLLTKIIPLTEKVEVIEAGDAMEE